MLTEKFISGVDFYKINQPDEIRRLGLERRQGGTPSETVLITETGYLMLVKSFTDDLAWKVQRELVDSYFRVRAEPETVETFMIVLDIAEELCTCNDEMYMKLLPIFKEFYSLVGDADAEIKFIKEQRKELLGI